MSFKIKSDHSYAEELRFLLTGEHNYSKNNVVSSSFLSL